MTNDTFKPHGLSKPRTATLHIEDSGDWTVLKNKEIRVSQGGKGLSMVELDGTFIPIKTKSGRLSFKEERKFKPSGAFLIVLLFLADYALIIWNINLQTGENYLNAVTIITMIFGAGFALFALRTLIKQVEYHLFLTKQKLKYTSLDQESKYQDYIRTVVQSKGFDETALYASAFAGLIFGFVIGLAMFYSVKLKLLDTIDSSLRWILYNEELGQQVLQGYIQTRDLFNWFMIIGLVVLLAVVCSSIVIMWRTVKKAKVVKSANNVYLGDVLNFNPETKKFKVVDAFYDIFESDQADVSTLNSVVTEEVKKEIKLTKAELEELKQIEQERLIIAEEVKKNYTPEFVEAKETGREYIAETERLLLDDEPIRKNLELEQARKLIYDRYDELADSYDGILVKNILDQQHQDVKLFMETSILQFKKIDRLESENKGYQESLKEAHDTLEKHQLLLSNAPESDKNKKLSTLEIILFSIIGLLVVGFIVTLIVILGGVNTI